ncbi:unnamed protein product [Anisakis simplex]|uniref:ABC transporter domain-containing protein n=1 Tax=Anisakis simplex TaxID=6269 RepID=A0A0M3JYX5_ANISI|nr:unnamed protein product [Anisakis simplex]
MHARETKEVAMFIAKIHLYIDETCRAEMINTNLVDEKYVLECRNISFVKTINVGKWYAQLYNPPLHAQFLNDVSLEVHSDEIHGITGVAADRFNKFCAYISFSQPLIPTLTVKSTLDFYAELMISGIDDKRKKERVVTLMQDFDLITYGHVKVKSLRKSAKRRLLFCIYLLSDPVLILMDDPTKGIDALCGYQLMSLLNSYMIRYHRMAIVSMRYPRSDIYQLMTRITILFYGQTVYSGYNKQMPYYFRQNGYPCPNNENPAVYYLSLATTDRETSERYNETQNQAIKLIELFKQCNMPSQQRPLEPSVSEPIYPNTGHIPLCVLNKPDLFIRLFALIRRNVVVLLSMCDALLCRIILLPLCALCIAFYGIELPHQGPNMPSSLAALFFNCMLLFSFAGIFCAVSSYSVLRLQMAFEITNGLISSALGVLSFLIACLPIDILAISTSISILIWLINLSPGLFDYALISFLIWSSYQISFMTTVSLMNLIRSSFKAMFISLTFTASSIVYAGAFLRSPRSYASISSSIYYGESFPSSILCHQTGIKCTSVLYVVVPLSHKSKMSRNFGPKSRWNNGKDYLDEIYAEDEYSMNMTLCLVGIIFYMISLSVIVIVCYRGSVVRDDCNKLKR